jgi:hypothetical protein
MVGDAKSQANHRGDPATSPDLSPKAIGFGPLVQEHGQPRQLVGGQPAGSTGAWTLPEGLQAPFAGTLPPLADRPFADAQSFGDLALGPALLHEVPALKPSGFLPIFGCAVHAWECSRTLPKL